jgi:hypothetical protein
MRPSTEAALKRAAELTRNNHLVEAVALAEAAINRATDDEGPEIQQWLTEHADDFTGRED